MSESTTIRYERGEDGIVVLTLDDPNQSANTMNEAYKASMAATVERLEAEKDSISGVVITSAKRTFFAGGDLNDLKKARKEDAAEVAQAAHGDDRIPHERRACDDADRHQSDVPREPVGGECAEDERDGAGCERGEHQHEARGARVVVRRRHFVLESKEEPHCARGVGNGGGADDS